MTRRKEIKQKALSKYPQGTNRYNKFIEGARWADKTMIEKACEWLMRYGCEYATEEVMVEHFRKAMEE